MMSFSPQDAVANEPPCPSAAPSNGQLLSAFVRHRDETAFAELVHRHGPMVFGVCRRLLGNEHDAADAFQAAFLVLARKAATLRSPDVLGAWLYHVAYRTSMKARAVRLKREARERQVSVMPETAVEPVPVDDVSEVLDEELRALPAKYQAPIVLCDLQGHTRKEVARALKVPEGTLSSRLAAGRQKLADRLRRRGVVVSATALAITLAQTASAATVPAPLVLATVKAALPAAAGHMAAGLVSAKTLAIFDGVMKSMLLAKLKLALLAVLGLCTLGGALHVGLGLANGQPDEQAQALATLTNLGARFRWELTPAGKQLVLVDLKRTPAKDEHVKLLALFPELREVSLGESAATGVGCAHLAQLSKLHTLRMNGAPVSDAGLKAIAGLTNLKVLSVGWSKISDAGLGELAALGELRELDLRHTGVTDAGLPALAPLHKLHTLEMAKTLVTDAGLGRLAALPGLRTLRLENTAITDRGLRDLAAGGQIQTLSLEGTAVSDAGLKDLTPLKDLAGLNLSGTRVTDAGLPDLAGFKQLRFLALDRTAVTGTGFGDGLTFKLDTLWLNGAKVTDATLGHVAAIGTLQRLHLEKTGITDVGVNRLPALTQLDALVLEKTAVTDDCLIDLAMIKRLNTLNLSGTKITDAGLKRLAGCAELRWLALHDTAVTDAGLKHLAGLRNLDTLWLSWTKLSEAGLKDLAAFKRLRTLRLGGLPVTDAGLRDLAPLKELQTLWLDWTKISDDGLKELAALKELEELRLDGTAVSAAGLKHLAALKQLERLELQGTQITQAGLTEVRKALPQVVLNTRKAGGDAAAEPEEGPRAFGWLVAVMAALAGVALVGWVFIKRRSVVEAALVACTLALVALIGYAVTLGSGSAAETTNAQTANAPPPREMILRGHSGPVHCLQFTPDGSRLVSGSGWPGKDKSVRIWDLGTEQELYRIEAPGMVGSMVLSGDGRFALVGAAGALLYIDVEAGEVRKRLKTTYAGCPSVCFAADGRHCYSAHQDGYARRWDLETGREVAKFRVAGKWARLAAELPDGRLLTANEAGLLQFWDVQTGAEVKQLNTGLTWMSSATLLPGGRRAMTAGWVASVWDLDSGEKTQAFRHKGDVPSMTLSPDGKTLLTASFDGTSRLWDFESGTPLRVVMSHEEWLFAATFSRDGRWIAAAGGGRKDGTKFEPGTAHEIHLFELPAPPTDTAAAPATDAAGGNGLWIAGLVALATGSLATLLWLRRRRRLSEPAGAPADEEVEPAPLPVTFTCSHCGKRLRVRPQLAGKSVKCPKCAAATRVPAPAS